MTLHVLLVEDSAEDLAAYLRDLPAVFTAAGVDVRLHPVADFAEAMAIVDAGHQRFDLIMSDTYRGDFNQHDVAVLDMVNAYRAGKFSPLIVFSASAQPPHLPVGPFIIWADKTAAPGAPGSIERAIQRMLATGVPQAARQLRDELDRFAGSYLWQFLEDNWTRLEADGHVAVATVGRLIRRRAALQIAEIAESEDGVDQIAEIHGLEYYMYPPINTTQYTLGQIIRHRVEHHDIRVILTPRCYLAVHPGQDVPRAKFVRVVKAVRVADVISAAKRQNIREHEDVARRDERLRTLITPPSGQDVGKPEGRYWYLPALLDIPHSYCDFLQIDSLPYEIIENDYTSLAVLSPPYAESLQACCKTFDSAVGIPDIVPSSVLSFLV